MKTSYGGEREATKSILLSSMKRCLPFILEDSVAMFQKRRSSHQEEQGIYETEHTLLIIS
jgi:hypothetical protein